MYRCDSWTIKKAEQWRIDASEVFWSLLKSSLLEKTLESPLDCKEIQPVNQSWVFIEMTEAEAEAPILWPPDVKNWLIRKDPGAGKDWSQEKGTTEDEMVGWHHRLDWRESERALGVGDGQGGLACCSQWGRKESDTTRTELTECMGESPLSSREAQHPTQQIHACHNIQCGRLVAQSSRY